MYPSCSPLALYSMPPWPLRVLTPKVAPITAIRRSPSIEIREPWRTRRYDNLPLSLSAIEVTCWPCVRSARSTTTTLRHTAGKPIEVRKLNTWAAGSRCWLQSKSVGGHLERLTNWPWRWNIINIWIQLQKNCSVINKTISTVNSQIIKRWPVRFHTRQRKRGKRDSLFKTVKVGREFDPVKLSINWSAVKWAMHSHSQSC